MEYKIFSASLLNEIKTIYSDSNWQTYLNDDNKLIRAFNNSLYILGAFDNEKLVGFVRCVGDGEHIVIIQDLIVLSEYQQKSIGTYLFKHCLDKYKEVRMFQVITDIEDKIDNHFYQSFNMKKLDEGHMVSYFR